MPSEQTLQLLTTLPHLGPNEYDPMWDEIDWGGLGPDHYDRDGEPISMRQWGMLRQLPFEEYARIGSTEIPPYWVSTVWLGIDHGFGFGPPIIFETMVWRGRESDLDCWRYSTEEEALEGHEEMCEQVRLIAAAET